jgi:hypothetical protein
MISECCVTYHHDDCSRFKNTSQEDQILQISLACETQEEANQDEKGENSISILINPNKEGADLTDWTPSATIEMNLEVLS